MKRRFSFAKERSGAISVLLGIAVSAICVFAFSLVLALIAYKSADPTAKAGIYSMIVLIISSLVSGIAVSRLKRDGGVLCACISASIFVLILLSVKLCFGKGLTVPFGINCASYIAISTVVSYLLRPKTRRRHR